MNVVKGRGKITYCQTFREMVLKSKMFNESVDSLNKLTIDELLWMVELIEIDSYMESSWGLEQKRIDSKR